ncbi:MAG: beta-lactamase family protein, partial [Deltaproteobacteria bacterium]|nr:beta-lactamase family protein [Deltaproteobacteria bacterium]
MKAEAFAQRCPKTAALLAGAVGEVFPSYAVGVSVGGHEWLGAGGAARVESFFDLASLTKVASTTTLLALLAQDGKLSVDARLADFYPGFSDKRVKLAHLLDHSSGFPWWLPLHAQFHLDKNPGPFDPAKTPGEARAYYEKAILESFNPAEFERQAVYSDLGFLLLGWLLEKIGGAPLDALFQKRVAEGLRLPSLRYLPLGRSK